MYIVTSLEFGLKIPSLFVCHRALTKTVVDECRAIDDNVIIYYRNITVHYYFNLQRHVDVSII